MQAVGLPDALNRAHLVGLPDALNRAQADADDLGHCARPVQWVVSPGGSEQVSASTFATIAGGNNGGLGYGQGIEL